MKITRRSLQHTERLRGGRAPAVESATLTYCTLWVFQNGDALTLQNGMVCGSVTSSPRDRYSESDEI